MKTRKKRATPVAQSGLTLVELIIALSLTVFIMLAVFSGLHLAVGSSERGTSHSEDVNQIRVVRDWIRRRIETAKPVLVEPDSGNPVVSFRGDPSEVRLVSPLPAHLGGGGLYMIQIGVDEDFTGSHLSVKYHLRHPDVTDGAEPSKQKRLLEAVNAVRFRYYGARNENEAPAWRGQWHDAEMLPALVSLELGFADPSRKGWITLIVAPMSDGNAERASVLVNGRPSL